jgi:SnoaL-like protein
MSLPNLPAPVQAFLSAMQTRDHAALLASLDVDASLVDEGQAHSGDAIGDWLMALPADRIGSHRCISDARRAGQTVVTVLTEEAARDGSVAEVLRDWHFKTWADRVLSVRIDRRPVPDLPEALAGYVRAMNRFDLEGLVAAFADDALVNDQLHDHWGKPAIREWAEREVVSPRMTMHVVGVVEHYGHVIVTAHVNGEFDRRGLPDPLVLSFYFSSVADRIVQLIILRNQTA